MLNLSVVIASTRPGRVGLPVGKWFYEVAKSDEHFNAKLVDLLQVNLPVLDEPQHPRLKQYQHAHTRAWGKIVEESDAFVFVTPEYNFFMPPALLNAMDYLYVEWNYKPLGLVSYGGVSGGLRSAQATKLAATSFKMMPIPESVSIHRVPTLMESGEFKAEEHHVQAAQAMLLELARWGEALKPLRS